MTDLATTTVRASTTDLLDSIRNKNNRLALLTLRGVNRKLTEKEKAEVKQLHKDLDRLQSEYRDARKFLEMRQKELEAEDRRTMIRKSEVIRRS